MVWSLGSLMVGLASAVMINVWGAPKQPFAIGITVMVLAPALVVVKLILPVSLAGSPIPVLLFVQLNVAPVVPEKLTDTI